MSGRAGTILLMTGALALSCGVPFADAASERVGDSLAPRENRPGSATTTAPVPPVRGSAEPKLRISSLASLPQVTLERGGGEAEEEPPFEPNMSPDLRLSDDPLAPVMADVPSAIESPARAQAFAYSHHLDASFGGPFQSGVPADCHMAAGPAHVVVVINGVMNVYTKAGALVATSPLDALLVPPSGWGRTFDPKVRYDWLRGRFFLVALTARPGVAESAYELAVSNSSDPTQGWYVYELRNESGGRGIDYPELGIGPEAVYLTGNYIRFDGWPVPPTGLRGSAWAIDKDALVAGTSVSWWRFDDVRGPSNEVVGTIKPSSWPLQPSPGVDNFMLALGTGTSSGVRRVLVYGWNVPLAFPAQPPTLGIGYTDTPASAPVPNARQLGGPAVLITNNLGPVWLGASYSGGGRLYGSMPVASGSRCAARSYVVDTSAWPSISIERMEDFTDGVADHYWPNTAGNQYGEQGIVMSRSSPTEYAGCFWSFRQVDGGYPGEFTLQAGNAYNGFPTDTPSSGYRWGDYAGIDADPVDQGFWFFDSYATSLNGLPYYSTWIGHLRRAEFVDVAWGGLALGTWNQPWRDIQPAVNSARNDNDLVIRTGFYPVLGTITINKRLDVIPDGGVVTIGP